MAAGLYDIASINAAGVPANAALKGASKKQIDKSMEYFMSGTVEPEILKDAIKKKLRIKDEQTAINRYKWFNLPSGLTGQMVERMLYYRGQLAFFFMKEDNKFYMLPYALSGPEGIDVYGRFKSITPLPFNGKSETDKAWITGLLKKPIYDVLETQSLDAMLDGCVLLHDYTPQLAQTIIPRQILQDDLLDSMSEVYPLCRTNLISNSGVTGIRVGNQDEYSNVEAANRTMFRNALTGKPFTPIIGNIDFQSLTDGKLLRTEEYLSYYQSLDNLRLSFYGIENGGAFQKKEHMLQSEQELNAGNTDLVYQDGLIIRQHFCDLVNNIWHLGIWCEECQTVQEKEMLESALEDSSEGQDINTEEVESTGEEND